MSRVRGLCGLPQEILEIIAKSLLPYDVLALSSTCKLLRPILYEKSVWLQISNVISHSRPLPYTAKQALELPISDLHRACTRSQRLSQKWSKNDIYPNAPPVKISFTDKRAISYFTFLPGSRHLMVFDSKNSLSCWSIHGKFLANYQVAEGATLTRWKPCDESDQESCYGMHTVEIMLECQGRRNTGQPCRNDIVLLLYSAYNEGYAKFTPVNAFSVPAAFDPFSAMTQDELRGSLVILSDISLYRVGIYLTDRNTEKAICVDTELQQECVPQALLSSQYVVLYWESHRGAHVVTYDLNDLRAALLQSGVAQDDPLLTTPIHVPPCDRRTIEFITSPSYYMRPPILDGLLAPGTSSRTDNASEELDELDDDGSIYSFDSVIDQERDFYPVIIPKWTTLHEDLRRHRTRSVLTFSREPHLHGMDDDDDEDGFGMMVGVQPIAPVDMDAIPNGVQAINGGIAGVGDHQPNLPPPNVQVNGVAYANANNGMNANNDDAPDLLPAIEHVPGNVPIAVNDDDDEFEDGHVHIFHTRAPLTTITHHYFDYIPTSNVMNMKRTMIARVRLRRPQNIRAYRAAANVINDALATGTIPTNLVDNFLGEIGLPPDQADHAMHQVLEALDSAQDMSAASPVMGYGGRCAMWVEEVQDESANGDLAERPPTSAAKLATFPAFEAQFEHGRSGGRPVEVHAELEEANGKVGNLHFPAEVSLDHAYTFDLDDVRGLVGVATSIDGLWLIDYS